MATILVLILDLRQLFIIVDQHKTASVSYPQLLGTRRGLAERFTLVIDEPVLQYVRRSNCGVDEIATEGSGIQLFNDTVVHFITGLLK